MGKRAIETAQEWMKRSQSNLSRAYQPKPADACWEDWCFDAQQAAEKAIKSVFILKQKKFPYSHDIGELLNELEKFMSDLPPQLRESSLLSDYAVSTRYPSWGEPVSEEEFLKARELAEYVVKWAREQFS